MLLSQEALDQAYNFKMDVKRFGYDTSFRELSFSKGNKNYQKILKKLEAIKLPNPTLFKYNNLTLEELKSLLSEILVKILGEEHSIEIAYLNRLLHPTRTSDIFDAALEEDLEGTCFIPKRIHINRALATIQVASTGHEYIHALLSKYKGYNFNKIMTNIHYTELLSILTEYAIVYELSQILQDESLRDKHSILRAYWDREHALEHRQSEIVKTQLSKKIFDKQTTEFYRIYFDYEEHNSFGYIVSDVYSRRLINLYQEDPKTLLSILSHIISGEKSIQDLLKHYDLSLNKSPVIETFEKELERIRLK